MLAAIYRGARCCAYVPIVEGFGLPVVEAMAQGTPVVSTQVPSAGGASLEVEATDVASIAEGLVLTAATSRREPSFWRGATTRRVPALGRHGAGPCRRLGAGHRRGTGPAMTPARAGSALQVALDVSAVPERPVGAGRYIVELARALARREDCGLTLLARRDDGARWAVSSPEDSGCSQSLPAGVRARLWYERSRLALGRGGPWLTGRAGVPRPALLDAPAVESALRRDRPRHDVLRSRRVARSEQGGLVPLRPALFGRPRRGHCLRERAHRSPPARTSCSALPGRRRAPRGRPQAFRGRGAGPGADDGVLERLGLRRPYLLHLGTLEPRKGIGDLVVAFDRIAGDHPELELVLAGGAGWKAGPVMQSVAKARAGARIRRLGYVADDDVPALLRRAQCGRLPLARGGLRSSCPRGPGLRRPLVTTPGPPWPKSPAMRPACAAG